MRQSGLNFGPRSSMGESLTDSFEALPLIAPTRRQADEWALVLASASIPCRVDHSTRGWTVFVATNDTEHATRTLTAYLEENQPLPVAREAPEFGRTCAGFAAAAFLLVFYLLTGPRQANTWFQAGSASAARIMDGELWRSVTALTLHSNLAHVSANAVSCCIFGTAVCRTLGPGLGILLMLLAGAGGNTLNAALHRSQHLSVGASTAIFGALGILAAVQMMRRRRVRSRWRAWLPVAAGLALLAFLGTGPQSDITAHFFGFLVGGGLGVTVVTVLSRPPGIGVQLLLALCSAVIVIGCWVAALG